MQWRRTVAIYFVPGVSWHTGVTTDTHSPVDVQIVDEM